MLRGIKLETDLIENLDDINLRILSLLQEDCRLSFNKLVVKLGISVGAAFNHVKNLEKKVIQKGYTEILDSVKLWYSLTVIIMVQAEGSYYGDVKKHAESANVAAVYDIAIAKFKDRTSLNAFMKNLLTSQHIKRTVTHLALNVINEYKGFTVNFKEKGTILYWWEEKR